MYYKLRPRSNTPGEKKYPSEIPRSSLTEYPSLSLAIVAGVTDLIEHRVYDARLIKATTRPSLTPFAIRRRPRRLPRKWRRSS